MMRPVNSSRQRVTRREALAAGGAGPAAALLPEAVHGQQSTRSGKDLQAILSRMTLADKVGQLLMAYLEPTTLEEKTVRWEVPPQSAVVLHIQERSEVLGVSFQLAVDGKIASWKLTPRSTSLE